MGLGFGFLALQHVQQRGHAGQAAAIGLFQHLAGLGAHAGLAAADHDLLGLGQDGGGVLHMGQLVLCLGAALGRGALQQVDSLLALCLGIRGLFGACRCLQTAAGLVQLALCVAVAVMQGLQQTFGFGVAGTAHLQQLLDVLALGGVVPAVQQGVGAGKQLLLALGIAGLPLHFGIDAGHTAGEHLLLDVVLF